MIKLAPIAQAILKELDAREQAENGTADSPAPQSSQLKLTAEFQAALNRRTEVIALRKDKSIEFRLHKSDAAALVYAIAILTAEVHLICWSLQQPGDAQAKEEFHKLVDSLKGSNWGQG